MKSRKEREDDEYWKDIYRRTFIGKASEQEALSCLGHIMMSMRLWSELIDPESVALHNEAMRMLRRMGMVYVLDPKDAKTVHFEVVGESIEGDGFPEEPKDERRT